MNNIIDYIDKGVKTFELGKSLYEKVRRKGLGEAIKSEEGKQIANMTKGLIDRTQAGNSFQQIVKTSKTTPVGSTSFNLNMGEAKPVETKLDMNIINRGYVDTSGMSNDTKSSMHITMFDISFSQLLLDGSVRAYFENLIMPEIRNVAQSNKGSYNTLIGKTLDDLNLINYFDTIIRGLNIYFYVKSVLEYTNEPTNRNDGMWNIRNGFEPSMLDKWTQMEHRMLGTVIPPVLVNFIFWLNGNYNLGMTKNSSLIKATPVMPNQDIGNENIEKAIDSFFTTMQLLNESAYIESILYDCFPTWRIDALPSYGPDTTHDTTFLTFIANAPSFANTSSRAVRTPTVLSLGEEIRFAAFDDEFGGAIYSLISVWVTSLSANDKWTPGLLKPHVFAGYNRYSYAGFDSWVARSVDHRGQVPELHFITNGGNIRTECPWGFESIRGITSETIRQSSRDFIETLFDLPNAKLVSSNTSSKRKGRTRNRKRKDENKSDN